MYNKIARMISDIAGNIRASFFGNQLTYIVESDAWSIKEDGKSITNELNRQHLLQARISTTSIGLRNQIVHFGSINTYRWHKPHYSNKIVVTWFHVIPHDERLKRLKQVQADINVIHTSCQSTKLALIASGIDEQKIVVIPLGVNLDLFTPTTNESRSTIRNQLGISLDRFVIGSFQKDGVGWGEGLEPKLIKGPDIFVEVISQLKHLNPFILLTGPARGYMKHELQKHGIEYKHIYLKNFHNLPNMYHALDVYLITSRIEGGPKAILEAWASGIPVVSTPVGMVPDVATQEENVLLSEPEDVESLAKQVERFVSDLSLRERLVASGCEEVKKYGWENVARTYYQSIYKQILT